MSLDQLIKKDLVAKAHTLGISIGRGNKDELGTGILTEEAEQCQILEPELEPEGEEYLSPINPTP